MTSVALVPNRILTHQGRTRGGGGGVPQTDESTYENYLTNLLSLELCKYT